MCALPCFRDMPALPSSASFNEHTACATTEPAKALRLAQSPVQQDVPRIDRTSEVLERVTLERPKER